MTMLPFPSQDLAKLVLGYLAEEQLMTAYDEFLQASPYLDALSNEYDRIFMTSLKNILAEYRAVKIYVETCRPLMLRKRLLQCTNLLEVVKFLVQNMDINKTKVQDENTATTSSDSQLNQCHKKNQCQGCNSLNLTSCICKIDSPSSQYFCIKGSQSEHSDVTNVESLVETTPLSDLPGNYASTKKKHLKVLEKQPSMMSSDTSSENGTEKEISHQNLAKEKVIVESSQKTEEFNDILSKVYVNNNTDGGNDTKQTLTTVPTFQDFSAGVKGVTNENITTLPNTVSKESVSVQLPIQNQSGTSQYSESSNLEEKVINDQSENIKSAECQPSNQNHSSKTFNYNTQNKRIAPNVHNSKVTILSDIKVDGTKNNLRLLPLSYNVSNNATSKPLLQMQTIFVNGTPAYKTNSQVGHYSKDEIMAMPTIILIPTSAPTTCTWSKPKLSVSQNNITTCTTSSSKAQSLEPLTIDITDSPEHSDNCAGTLNLLQSVDKPTVTRESPVVKLSTTTRNTAPKDTTVGESDKIGTPHMVPPVRKSSSTPRRTSHVRVLDFTTPRRILHESVSDHHSSGSGTSEPSVSVKNDNTQLITTGQTPDDVKTIKSKLDSSNEISSGCTKENTNTNNILTKKSYNWDSDLRALAVTNKDDYRHVSSTRVKTKISKTKLNKKNDAESDVKKSLSKNKSSKRKKQKLEEQKESKPITNEKEAVEIVSKAVDIIVKPTINIKSGTDRIGAPLQENDKPNNISNVDDQVNTTDMDTLSLNNAIDLLETPFKQVLYEIQMETPKFLDPDIPVEPMSDIKIMNIPTPRFLGTSNSSSTPKPGQFSPSSYSSRPTDYSSGGSYYKPEDQDYMRISEDVLCPVKEKNISESYDVEKKVDVCLEKSSPLKSSRPVRQCRKNVSYYNSFSTTTNKCKDEDKIETASSCSESLCENDKERARPVSCDGKPNVKKKTANKRTSKKKSPLKNENSKNFMKIKTRRLTPSKENIKSKRKLKENELLEKLGNKDIPVITMSPLVLVPTKSRRKSSTPRKLDCTQTFHSEDQCNNSPEVSKSKKTITQNITNSCAQESDTEQIVLQWSDDGSLDCKQKDVQVNIVVNDSEDISKIQEYIQTSALNKPDSTIETEEYTQKSLMKQGFDLQTAKNIERDLLDTSPCPKQCDELTRTINNERLIDKSTKLECKPLSNLPTVQEDLDEDQWELSVHECNEDSPNYLVFHYDNKKDNAGNPPMHLKDTFSMEVCIDDDVCIRLRAMPFSSLFDEYPNENEDKIIEYSKNTEIGVRSRLDLLNTPMKETLKHQCYEIFDSTLTSLDTPIKQCSPTKIENNMTVSEVVLEVEEMGEKMNSQDKSEAKRRKRLYSSNSSNESFNENKKLKAEAEYMLDSASIQNIDIESLLSKLHGP